jgi:hypothetical protein
MIQVLIAIIGLAAEIFKYLREMDAKKNDKARMINEFKKSINIARLYGDHSFIDDAFNDLMQNLKSRTTGNSGRSDDMDDKPKQEPNRKTE